MKRTLKITAAAALVSLAAISGMATAKDTVGISIQLGTPVQYAPPPAPVHVQYPSYASPSRDEWRQHQWERDQRRGEPGVVLYDHDGFRGVARRVEHNIANIDTQGFGNRSSSMVVTGGQWLVCQHPNFGGHCAVVNPGSYPTLKSMGLDNSISSLRRLGPRDRYWVTRR